MMVDVCRDRHARRDGVYMIPYRLSVCGPGEGAKRWAGITNNVACCV